MNERKITEKESLEIISSMIARTQEHTYHSGAPLLLMGCVTAVTAIAVWLLCQTTGNAEWNWLWLILPVAGCFAVPAISRRKVEKVGAKTYYGVLIRKIWGAVSISCCVAALVCAAAELFADIDCWKAMLVFPIIVVAFAQIVQGLLIRECSLTASGAFGLLLGIALAAGVAGGIVISTYWYLPIFVPLAAMMIIPGFILNQKARRVCKN